MMQNSTLSNNVKNVPINVGTWYEQSTFIVFEILD